MSPPARASQAIEERQAIPFWKHCSGYGLRRCFREVGFVFGIRLAIIDLDIDPARRNHALLCKPNAVEIRRLAEGAKSVEPFSPLIVEVHPRARRLRVCAAWWQGRRGSEKLRGVFCLVEHVVTITNPILAAS